MCKMIPLILLSVRVDYKEIGDLIVWDMDIFWPIHLHFQLKITHSIQRAIPIRALELFDFYADRSDLENPALILCPFTPVGFAKGKYFTLDEGGTERGWSDLSCSRI